MRSEDIIGYAGQAGQALGLLLMGFGLGLLTAGSWVQRQAGILAASRAGIGTIETWTYLAAAGFAVCFLVAFAAEWYEQQTEASGAETA